MTTLINVSTGYDAISNTTLPIEETSYVETNSDENISTELQGATGVSNPTFDYDRYKSRVRANEKREERNLENARNSMRNRILTEHNLPQLHHPVLIPPSVESDNEYGSLNRVVIQDPTITSTVENANVALRLWNFFKTLSR